MKLVRLKKGRNDFALANLTVGKLMAIKHALETAETVRGLGASGRELLESLRFWNVDSIELFDNTFVGKVRPTGW